MLMLLSCPFDTLHAGCKRLQNLCGWDLCQLALQTFTTHFAFYHSAVITLSSVLLSSAPELICHSRQETTLNHSTLAVGGLGLVSVTFVPVTLSHYTEIR